MRKSVTLAVMGVCSIACANVASASVTWYLNRSAWQTQAGQCSTITFAELPANTWITNQYADLGVHFTDGSDQIDFDPSLYSDSYGLNGAFDESTLEFDAPITTIAVTFPGDVAFNLYSNGRLIATSYIPGLLPVGNFRGLISTEPFDSAQLYDPLSGLFVDNLYFGPPIPAPAGMWVLSLAVMCRHRRRR